MQNNTIDISPEQIQGFRLSPQQKRAWNLHSKTSNNPYQTKVVIAIKGKLDRERLKQAWEKIVERHEILRTSFSDLAEVNLPLQIIDDRHKFTWQYLDLNQLELDSESPLKSFLDLENNNSNLSLSLIKKLTEEYILLIEFPAFYGDALSCQKIVKEIDYHYHNLIFELDEEPIQYADFAEWQNELLEGDETKIGCARWQQINFQDPLNLQSPLERKISELFNPQAFDLAIDEELLKQIEEKQIPHAAFLFTCWQILIYRLTDRTNLTLGITGNAKKYAELESTLGLIAKYLPIQNNLTSEITAAKLCQENSNLIQEAELWEEYFIWQDDAIFLPFVFEYNSGYSSKHNRDVSFLIERIYSCIDRFKIKLACQEQEHDLAFTLHYDANLFAENTIQSLGKYWNTLITNVLNNNNIDIPIDDLEILSQSEKQQIIIDFNNTNTEFPLLKNIQQSFERQVVKAPDATALIYQNEQLTYQQLNQRANQLAHYLKKQNIDLEDLVGIYFTPSLEAIIAILGILKAGAGYVPLDPHLPPERLTWMLEDTQAKIILTQQKLVANLPESKTNTICLDSQWSTIEPESTDNLDCIASLENLAYIIYTSGSTGKPKGVAIEHRQIINYLQSILAKLSPQNSTNFALVSTLSADLGNTMLFPALSTGGCLHLIPDEYVTDGEALGKYFQQHQIDYLKITPSHLTALFSSSQPELILPRKTLVLGGEALSKSLVEKIRSLNANCSILNHYGPTETTVGVLTYEVSEELEDSLTNTVPLGKPLANNRVYILDNRLQPVPICVSGELYIGGAQVSRGYLNRPELTKKRFIQNPIPPQSLSKGGWGDRLYRTGDKARYLPNHSIEFLGRVDNQVKIRGFRLELAEIETSLSQHLAIARAIVRFDSDNQRLIAYLTAQSDFSPPDSSELRDFLGTKLPEYAIPAAFVSLKEFPLTSNGKIDRQQLPNPETISPELTATFVAPQTNTEKAIADIWIEILGVERVGIHDDFFELGGHSLLATQVVSRIRRTLQTELSLRQFFDTSTVGELATIIEQNIIENVDEAILAQMLAELEEGNE